MTEKSILEQALLQINTLEEAVKQNAKGILASTMKQELNEMLKESLEEEEDVVANEEEEEETSEETSMEEQGASEEEEEDEIPADDADDLGDLDNDETEGGSDELDSEMEDEMEDEMDDEESDMEDEMGDEMDDEMGDEDALDLTGASDEEVMKVFKAMKPEDGIIVKKNEDSVEFSDGENEYLIKLDEEEEEETSDEEMDDEEMDDESIYEIELDEEEEEEEEETHEEEMEEAARTKSNPHGNKGGADRAGLPSKKKYKAGSGVVNEDYQNLLSEVEKLKKQNAMYKEAVVLFKDKLNEIAVFNASLAYSNRLFTEHSTTKQEKMNILKRFDAIQTIEESKSLFKTIKSELDNKKPVTESVVEKIVANPTTSSSQEMLSESKAYENPQFKRMKDLMSKLK